MKLIVSIKRVGLDVIFAGGDGTIGVQAFQSCQMTRWKTHGSVLCEKVM